MGGVEFYRTDKQKYNEMERRANTRIQQFTNCIFDLTKPNGQEVTRTGNIVLSISSTNETKIFYQRKTQGTNFFLSSSHVYRVIPNECIIQLNTELSTIRLMNVKDKDYTLQTIRIDMTKRRDFQKFVDQSASTEPSSVPTDLITFLNTIREYQIENSANFLKILHLLQSVNSPSVTARSSSGIATAAATQQQ